MNDLTCREIVQGTIGQQFDCPNYEAPPAKARDNGWARIADDPSDIKADIEHPLTKVKTMMSETNFLNEMQSFGETLSLIIEKANAEEAELGLEQIELMRQIQKPKSTLDVIEELKEENE